MHPDSKLASHKPSREHVKLIVAKEGWAVYLAPSAKVVDLAVIMKALRAPLQTVPEGMAHGFLLRPIDPKAPAPTSEEFDEIFGRGFDAGEQSPPYLLKRQAT